MTQKTPQNDAQYGTFYSGKGKSIYCLYEEIHRRPLQVGRLKCYICLWDLLKGNKTEWRTDGVLFSSILLFFPAYMVIKIKSSAFKRVFALECINTQATTEPRLSLKYHFL